MQELIRIIKSDNKKVFFYSTMMSYSLINQETYFFTFNIYYKK